MIGIDIIKISRMEKLLEKFGTKALRRFLCDEEIDNLAPSAQSAAGYWALKEAASKALGCGIGGEFGFFDIKIAKSDKGAPKISLSQRAIERFEITSAEASITHDGGFAVAVVHFETKREKSVESF